MDDTAAYFIIGCFAMFAAAGALGLLTEAIARTLDARAAARQLRIAARPFRGGS